MEFNEQKVQDYLKQQFQGRDSFLKNIIFPIFGEDHFDEGYDAELLDDPDVRRDAEKVGIRSIITYGRVGIDLGSIQIFDITVTDHVLLARNRVTVQGIIRRILGTFQSAFMIFHYEDTQRWDWRFSFCCKGDKEITEAKRFTFLLGPNQSCRTAAQNFVKLASSASASASPTMDDIKKAFDVETLSDEFFTKYKRHYEEIVKFITGKSFKKIGGKWKEVSEGVPNEEIYAQFDHDDKAVRDYVKKMLGRIVFLHFLQKKGWLGAKKTWDDGDPEFMLHLFQKSSEEQKDNFLDAVLEPLFDQALDADRVADGDAFDTHVSGVDKVKIPYLNGGLFTRDAADKTTVRLPRDYFRSFLVFLSEYNFTIDENDPSDAEVGVDPEMLSRIFENLLEDNKDKGAIYTPKPIVEHMCRQSLIAYLQTDMPEAEHAAIEKFVKTYNPSGLTKKTASTIDKKLKSVKICDPAIGSGAFPMGMLRELYFCRTALEDLDKFRPAEIKRQIIQENLYGVDIEKGAVDIARLRFWLALVVDEPTPHTLPNLDFKIMQGNSLLENYKGVPLGSLLKGKKLAGKKAKQNNFACDCRATYTQDELAFGGETASQAITELMSEYYSTDNRERKQNILVAINDQVKGYIKGQICNTELNAEIDALECQNDKFFLWHTWFADVFARGGFDIVIGNPPYVFARGSKEKGLTPEIKKYYYSHFELAKYQINLYHLFIERGTNLLRDNGLFAYIVPNNWLTINTNVALRKYILNMSDIRIVNFYKRVFKSADVDSSIILFRKATDNRLLTLSEVTANGNINLIIKKTSDVFLRKKDCVINVELFKNSAFEGVLTKIENASRELITIADVKSGLKAYEVGAGTPVQTEAMKKQRIYHSNEKEGDDYYPYLDGDDVKRYIITWEGREYLKYGKNLAAPRGNFGLFSTPRILVRQIPSRLPYCISACYTEEILLNDLNSINVINIQEDPKYILGVLNSRTISFWFAYKFGKMQRGIFPQFKVNELASFPIPHATNTKKKVIASLVDRILAAKAVDPAADTTELEKDIDNLVYKLYGLSPDEIKIVKGEGK